MEQLETIASEIESAFAVSPEAGTRAWTARYRDEVLVSHAHETMATDGPIAGDDIAALHRAEMAGWMKIPDLRVEATTKILAHGIGIDFVMSGTLPNGEPMRTRVWNRLTIDDGRIVGLENVHLEKCDEAFELGLFDDMIALARRLGVGLDAA